MNRDIPQWADKEAWEALNQANRRVSYLDPQTGKVWQLKEWQARQAPSAGARARSILRNLLFPPSYISACELALALYLSEPQNADRHGFFSPRDSNAPQRFTGVKHFG